jgi:hypothetical protein
MCDKLVFDLAQEVEGSPNVFVRKDWINILDNQNQNYNNNQSVIDTSQLSNSNKYMSYREAYFLIPFTVTLASSALTSTFPPAGATAPFNPTVAASSADYSLGLKNWFGQIIHSFTLDYNGTTIVQQTPYINMWNSFKLMTSLSLNDIATQGATIGFYPDDPLTWSFNPAASTSGQGVCNNTNYDIITQVGGAFNKFKSEGGNNGFVKRQQLINFDCLATAGSGGTTYGSLISGATGASGFNASLNLLWKSYISSRQAQTIAAGVQTAAGYIQYSIVATVYLKHIHSFFNMCPLLKGVFMKMTMNLNNTSTSFTTIAGTGTAGAGTIVAPVSMQVTGISNPLGGVNPLMVASGTSYSIYSGVTPPSTSQSLSNGGISLFPFVGLAGGAGGNATCTQSFIMNISVGATCLDAQLVGLPGANIPQGALAKSVYLYIPAYTFNPVFEQAYLSSPVKQIKYTDVYQYQVLNVPSSGMINNLLTNGIANVKSVLVLPYYNSANSGFNTGIPVWQSPFDPAGTGCTSPMSWITNFNIQVSGQNAIYNLEKYNFEQFNNQLYGQNAVNGGLTDGITSGLIDRMAFDMTYCYYYVNIERMLPVEMSVPKSIQLVGQNMSAKAMDYICFIEYGVEISIDALTGARV